MNPQWKNKKPDTLPSGIKNNFGKRTEGQCLVGFQKATIQMTPSVVKLHFRTKALHNQQKGKIINQE